MFCPVVTDDRVHSPAADTGRGGEDTAPRRGTPGHRGTRKMAEEKRTEGGGGGGRERSASASEARWIWEAEIKTRGRRRRRRSDDRKLSDVTMVGDGDRAELYSIVLR